MSRFFREMRQLEGKENVVILQKAKATTVEGEENVMILCKAKATKRRREYCDSL